MNIITFSEELQTRVQQIQITASNDISGRGKALYEIQKIVSELKEFTAKYTFLNTQEEIRFFKEVKPILMSQYYYVKKQFDLLLIDSFADSERQMDHHDKVLQKLNRFLRNHQSFYQYCLSGATDQDDQYFVRSKNVSMSVNLDNKFSTGYDLVLAKILANELVRESLVNEIQNGRSEKLNSNSSPLQWTSSKVSLVEMIYALHAAGVFDHGKTEIKKVVECFEHMCSIDLGSYARIFYEIRLRKKGQSNFIDLLKERLLTVIAEF